MRGSRRTRLTLVLLLLTAFTLTALDYNSAQSGPLASLRRGIDTVFGPAQRVVGSAANSVGNAFGGLPNIGSYQSKNRSLQRQLDKANGIIHSEAGLQCRLDQYYSLQHLVDLVNYPIVPAQVVSVGSSADFEKVATINVGTADGVQTNMTVVTGEGLVGRTTTVQAQTAQVLLESDPSFAVGGTLQGQSLPGIATGTGSAAMILKLPISKSVVIGTVLSTTGDGTYAAGIPIGTLTAISKNDDGFTATATIVPFVDTSTVLDVVGVITLRNAAAPAVPIRPLKVGPSPTSSPCAAAAPNGPVPHATPTPAPSPTPSTTPSP